VSPIYAECPRHLGNNSCKVTEADCADIIGVFEFTDSATCTSCRTQKETGQTSEKVEDFSKDHPPRPRGS
jgi:hypothetical protein